MTIGESIRYHRTKLQLTQAQLAQRLGVSAQAVSKWENNAGLPDVTMIEPLARALGTTTDEILRFGQRYQHMEACWGQTLRQKGDDPRFLLPVALDALKAFPFDPIFLFRAAVSQERLAEAEEDDERSAELIGQALVNARLCWEMARTETFQEYLSSLQAKVTECNGRYKLKNR